MRSFVPMLLLALSAAGEDDPAKFDPNEASLKKINHDLTQKQARILVEKLISGESDYLVRKQTALAIADMRGLSSWALVLKLRSMDTDSQTPEVRTAVQKALKAVAVPKDPDELQTIIEGYAFGFDDKQPDWIRSEACQTLAKEFPVHPKTVPTLRGILAGNYGKVLDEAAAKALESLEAKPKKPMKEAEGR